MRNRWPGRTALITGSSRGIGKAIAEKLASLGAAVDCVAVANFNCNQTANELREGGARVFAQAADVSSDTRRSCTR